MTKSKTNTSAHHIPQSEEKKHFDIKNNLILTSKINEALSCNALTAENNFILDFTMPVTADMMTFTVGVIIRENCFPSFHAQTKYDTLVTW